MENVATNSSNKNLDGCKASKHKNKMESIASYQLWLIVAILDLPLKLLQFLQ